MTQADQEELLKLRAEFGALADRMRAFSREVRHCTPHNVKRLSHTLGVLTYQESSLLRRMVEWADRLRETGSKRDAKRVDAFIADLLPHLRDSRSDARRWRRA